jgi:hypothetical protein
VTHWFKYSSTWSALLPMLLGVAANPAGADLLADAGQRALLTVSITVDGSVEKFQGYRDEVVKWSTRRVFDATVEMAADEPETMSFSDTLGGQGGPQQALLADIQKQAEACGQDQACQMQVAMQLMNSPAMQETLDAPLRYQAWRPVEEGARLEFSGSHEEILHTVFYTAARETTDCTLTAPKISPELTKVDATSGDKWAKVNQETLAGSARSFIVEIDSAGKAGVLNIGSPLGMGFGDIKCIQNIGSGPETSHHSTNATLLPTGELSLPLQVKGAASGNGVIASGSASVEGSQQLTNLGVGFAVDVKAPLTIAVRWELKKI